MFNVPLDHLGTLPVIGLFILAGTLLVIDPLCDYVTFYLHGPLFCHGDLLKLGPLYLSGTLRSVGLFFFDSTLYVYNPL